MHDKWCVGTSPEEVWIVCDFGSVVPEGAELISPANAAWQVEEWFPANGLGRQVLAEIHEQIGVSSPLRREDGSARVHDVIRDAFRDGVLKAYRIQLKLSGGTVQQKEPEKREKRVEQKSWIAIALMDDGDPPKPVPFKKYRIELPDRSVREGLLDENGQARFTGIDLGTCKVSFPQLHGDDWRSA